MNKGRITVSVIVTTDVFIVVDLVDSDQNRAVGDYLGLNFLDFLLDEDPILLTDKAITCVRIYSIDGFEVV